MAAASAPSGVPLSAPRPAAPAASGNPPAPEPPREGSVEDRGLARHDTVRARSWSATGTIKVTHEVDVDVAELRGTVAVGGPLRTGRLRARGSLEVGGAVVARESLDLRGDIRFGATLRAPEAELDGTLWSEGEVAVERLLSGHGTLRAPSARVGALRFDGEVRIPGDVDAQLVDVRLEGRSALGTVKAPVVRLRGRLPNLFDKVFFHEERARVGRVEADRVELEGVDVDFVRGREVALGRGCHVTTVEGTVVRRHPTSTVGPRSKSPPPYGLRR